MRGPLTIGGLPLGARPLVVAAGGEAELELLAAADGADVVEVRADLFDDPRPDTLVQALARLRAAGRPVLLTVRAETEGGRPWPDDRRAALYSAALPHVQAIDVEIVSRDLAADLAPRARAAGCLVLLSAHDFQATPACDVLLALIDRARALGADLPKVAAHAASPEDLRSLLDVTLAARDAGVVTLGMGPFGPLSRVVLPAAGSLLTYGSVGRPTAPGQVPVADLAGWLARLLPSRTGA
jgi:3-dehydroquinate dehydratase-1